jgi:hypothetical protein
MSQEDKYKKLAANEARMAVIRHLFKQTSGITIDMECQDQNNS